jgi:trans-aconitate methyltransferase
VTPEPNASEHWNGVYASGDEHRSWTQARAVPSVEAIRTSLVTTDAAIIDVGGGSSPLTGQLLSAGYHDLTVLDVSPTALFLARNRLGDAAANITWITADVLTWKPSRTYSLWHDRAVLHFFTEPKQRHSYARTLLDAVAPGGHAVIATFAPNGPDHCSGLPVKRSSAPEIMNLLGPRFTLQRAEIQTHITPDGAEQPFTWVIAHRQADPNTNDHNT